METAPHNPQKDERQAVKRFVDAAGVFQRTRTLRFTMMVGIGQVRLLVSVCDGRVDAIHALASLRPLTSWDFAVIAPVLSWKRFWEAVPEPGWHDVFALTRHNRMQIEGNLQPFMAHLQFVKDLLASPRREQNA